MSQNEQTLKNAIRDFLKVSHLSEKLAERKIIDNWEKIMGKMIARHTKEIFFRDKKIFVTLDSAPLRQELFYSRSKIVKMLNAAAGEDIIQEAVFK